MGDSHYILPAPETVSMSGDAARRLIGCGSGDAALLYLHILQSGGRLDVEDAAAHMGRTVLQVEAALAVLGRLGLVNSRETAGSGTQIKERPEELPQYSREDIQRELENGQEFPALVRECQKALGKILNSDELIRLFGIYDYLGLPAEVILQLISHCKEEQARRYGPGRVPTMRYIEKAAFTWERNGIFSLDSAEAYLKQLDDRRDACRRLARVMGIEGRALTTTERRYIESWTDLGFDTEALTLAFDRTVVKTGKLSWAYMNSIVMSWQQKNLHTVKEIEAGDPIGGPGKSGQKPKPKPSTQSQGVTASDMERMQRVLERLKSGEYE